MSENNLIQAYFTQAFRLEVYKFIKQFGAVSIEKKMITDGFHPSFVKALIKSIMGKEGW